MAAQSITKKNDKIIVEKSFFEQFVKQVQKENTNILLEQFKTVTTELTAIYNGSKGQFPKIENKPFYYFCDGGFYIADTERYQCAYSGNIPSVVDEVSTNWNMTDTDFSKLHQHHKICPIFDGYDANGNAKIKNTENRYWVLTYYSSYFRSLCVDNHGSSYRNGSYQSNVNNFGSDVIRLPISRATGVYNAVKYNLMPADLSPDSKMLFGIMAEYESKGYLAWNGNEITGFIADFHLAVSENKIPDTRAQHFKSETITKDIKDGKTVHMTDKLRTDFISRFVNVDKERADLTPYEEIRLTDPNGGHWDLWSSQAAENQVAVQVDTAFYGRNPAADVQHDGIVGIDFGTKSTVVTFQNGTDITQPMRIGRGDITRDVTPEDYENPTVMEFINLDRFLSCYKSSAGRPETKWADLVISHTAAENLNSMVWLTKATFLVWHSDILSLFQLKINDKISKRA